MPVPKPAADDGSGRSSRRHLLIAGTGRAGTSLLVRILHGCGLDTHLSRTPGATTDATARAGLEDLLIADDAPYVVKSPWSHQFLESCLSQGRIRLDAAIVPVRNLGVAAASRLILELQDRYRHATDTMIASGGAWGEWGTARGGMTYAIEPLDQERTLAVAFHRLIECLVRFGVPVIFLDYPRFAQDGDYLFAKLQPVIGDHIDRAGFEDLFRTVADPTLVRTEDEVRLALEASSTDLAAPARATRAGLEVRALHRVVGELRAHVADVETRCRLIEEEAEHLRTARDGLLAASDRLHQERASHEERLARLRREYEGAVAEIRRLEGECRTLTDEAQRLEKDRDALAAEAERLRAELRSRDCVERSLADLHRQGDVQGELLHRLAHHRRPGRWWDWLWLWPRMRGPWFDRGHYLSQVPEAAHSRLPLRLHYLLFGRSRDASPTPLFSPSYYRQRYPDVVATGIDPLFHYFRHGAAGGRKPSPGFDSGYYLAQNPDVARKKANPLRHYLNHGWREGRDPNPLFDTSFYLADGECAQEPLTHYLAVGAKAGRRPSPLFDAARYLLENSDVAVAGVNPLLHYLESGMAEGRARPGDGDLPQGNDGARACILLVHHGLGGGVERHCDDLEALLEVEGIAAWRLDSIASGSYRLRRRAIGIERGHVGEDALLQDLRRLRIDLVHVHHVIGFGARLWTWLAELSLPYDITIHDYAFACPRVHLMDGRGRYCGEPADPAACDRCVATQGAHPYLHSAFDAAGSVQAWRSASASILAGARRVYVPDRDVANRLRTYFPQIDTALRPHPEPPVPVPARPSAGGERVRVAVIGSIGPHKGFDILLACARAAQRDRLPLTFAVIGEVCAPEELAGLDTVEVIGRYREADLPRLFDEAWCHVAAFLSVVPETYGYALSAALRAGLYPVAFDLGAQASRIRQLGWGEVLPLGLAPAEINRRLIHAAIDHPIPTTGHVTGHDYGCMSDGYFGLALASAQ